MNLWHTKGFKWKIILSVLVFLLGLVCSTVFSVRMHQNALEARRKTAQLNATTYANYLIEDFSQAIGVTYALEQILISEDGQCKRFETVAQNLSSSVVFSWPPTASSPTSTLLRAMRTGRSTCSTTRAGASSAATGGTTTSPPCKAPFP